MERFFLFLMSALLIGLVCSSEKGGRYDQESLLSRSKRSKPGHRPCPCPDLSELQRPKKHKHPCPCDGFTLTSLSEHPSHPHPPRKNKQFVLRKKKCSRFLRHCAFKGIHIPL
ncbi:uncharacterized protein M6D78_012991 [Vipera latastei]